MDKTVKKMLKVIIYFPFESQWSRHLAGVSELFGSQVWMKSWSNLPLFHPGTLELEAVNSVTFMCVCVYVFFFNTEYFF